MQELSQRLARGDSAAFAELYDSCADVLHSYLVCRLGSSDAASDVVQETFLRLVRSRRRLKKVEKLMPYVFQIARNEANRWHKRNRKLARRAVHSIEETVEAPESAVDQIEARDTVTVALEQLNESEREIVQLKIYAGLTLREIAEITNDPPGTVATRYRRAIHRMRNSLAKELR